MNSSLSDNERLLLDAVSDESLSQRKISSVTGLSLGMTNMLLKKLASKGYIKIITLNGRTLRYILTRQGMKEKLRKSYDFLLRSVSEVLAIRGRVGDAAREYAGEDTVFVVLGENELSSMVIEFLNEKRLAFVQVPKDNSDLPGDGRRVVFVCDPDLEFASRTGDVLVHLTGD